MEGWICKACGQGVYTMGEKEPEPIRWNDGHTCHFKKFKIEDEKEGNNATGKS